MACAPDMNSPEMQALIKAGLASMEGATNPYALADAKGLSGLSFGEFQNDVLHAEEPIKKLFDDIIDLIPGLTPDEAADLKVKARTQPASAFDADPSKDLINAALNTQAGQDIVKQADAKTIENVTGQLKQVVDAAFVNPSPPGPGPGDFDPNSANFAKTIIAASAWINRTGPPDQFTQWVQGKPASLFVPGPVQLAGDKPPTLDAFINDYLPSTKQHADPSVTKVALKPDGTVKTNADGSPVILTGNGESLVKWNERLDAAVPLGKAAGVPGTPYLIMDAATSEFRGHLT